MSTSSVLVNKLAKGQIDKKTSARRKEGVRLGISVG